MFIAFFPDNAVAPIAASAVLIDETHSDQAKIGLPCEAGRRRLECLDECRRGRMAAKEFFQRRTREVSRDRWPPGLSRNSRNSSPSSRENDWSSASRCPYARVRRDGIESHSRVVRVRVVIQYYWDAVEFEKRTVAGVDGRIRWGTLLSEADSREGVNVPVTIIPSACAGRKPGGFPKILSNCLRTS